MTRHVVEIEIEGEFIDSYIYSGALFLVDYDGVLSTFRWSEILAYLENSYLIDESADTQMMEFLRDSRAANFIGRPEGNEECEPPTFKVSKKVLERFLGNTTPVEVWPTDFSIYSNRIYLSSEEGVDQFKFHWDNGKVLEISGKGRVWNKPAFRVCPNQMNRVAIAAGNDGLIAAAPHGEHVRDGDVTQILDVACGDCDWQDLTLVANTTEGVKVAPSKPIPNRKSWTGDDKEYWDAVNAIRQQPPRNFHDLQVGSRPVISAWIAGDKLFALDDVMMLHVAKTRPGASGNEASIDELSFDLLDFVPFNGINARILFSRTGPFGTLLETTEQLALLSEDGLRTLSKNAGRWRTFPRAKNYSNQLHILENDRLRILGFDVSRSDSADRFGFSLDAVSEQEAN